MKSKIFIYSLIAVTLTAHAGPQKLTSAGTQSLFDIPVKTLEDKPAKLSDYQGQVLMIVNTASKCGFTPQYEGLEAVSKKYRDQGLVILGFPSNDFGGQEPGTNKEIRFFCESNYHVDFPMFTKGPVTGPKIQPVFSWLLEHAPTHEPVGWNFEKFIVNRKGEVVRRFKSTTTPHDAEIESVIKTALSEKK